MRSINVVPHTHWDREWYLTFEEFRERLVETLDAVLDLLAGDERWSHFHLDGQTAMIDDYLAFRPEREREIIDFVQAGRLSCGPWVTLVDEFLVSGESIIRNLEDGMARSRALGGRLDVGYLPDQFGHVGQMPQILRSAGIEKVVVWRGVPSSIDRSRFAWAAPDGSEVLATYLAFGYGHGRLLPTASQAFTERLERERARLEPFLESSEPVLITAGSDHEAPDPALPDALERARGDGIDIRIASLTDHIDAQPGPRLSWRGELRSAARANLLPNTYSARLDQKLERARAEHLLERYAEPLAALVEGVEWPSDALAEAWMLLHLNGAHDSVCGCSTDAVAAAVDTRTARVEEIASRLAASALGVLARSVASPGTLAFNPSPFDRSGIPALGWKVLTTPLESRRQLSLRADGRELVVEETGQRLGFEDHADVGDLYTFCPEGPEVGPARVSAEHGVARVEFETCALELRASRSGDEDFVRFHAGIENRAPDHRLRAVVSCPTPTDGSLAGSVFEIVRRPPRGEGGSSEPPAKEWPARGFVVGGGTGLLSEGVVEYEVLGDALALTLLRCVGTISKGPMATRATVAGPDVAAPGAQMIGSTANAFGVLTSDPGDDIVRTWERYALDVLSIPCPGGGALPDVGSLADMDVPTLSSLRRRDGRIEARVWNPWDRPTPARIGAQTLELGPHRIESVVLG